LAVPPKLLDRAAARNCLLTNLLVLPGLGSLMAKRRVTGILQILLALTGFGLTGYWFTTFGVAWWQTESFPFDGGPHLRWGLLGVLLFLAGWGWGLATGLRIARAARKTNP
jgi:hypothetical protein